MNFVNDIIHFLTRKEVLGPLLIIIIGLILCKVITSSINSFINHGKKGFEAKKRKTITSLINNVIKYFIYILMVIFILNIYGVDTKSIIASLGVAGVILGFALQSTVEDLISGIAIIIENYFVIGDTVTYNNFTGEVIGMSLKSTKIKRANGEVFVIANRNIDEVINLSQERAGIQIKVSTAYEEKTEKVEKILKSIVEKAKKMENVFPESTYLGIDELGSSSINYALIIYCKQDDQWQIKRDVLKLIKDTYEKENIKIPYSQVEVHNGTKI